MSDLWPIITIVGPLLLAAVVIWAMLRNRASRASEARTEQATAANYEREEAARRRDENEP